MSLALKPAVVVERSTYTSAGAFTELSLLDFPPKRLDFRPGFQSRTFLA